MWELWFTLIWNPWEWILIQPCWTPAFLLRQSQTLFPVLLWMSSSATVREVKTQQVRWVGEICSRTRCVERRLGVHLHVCPLWSSFNKDTDPKSQRKCKIKTASCVSSWISLPTGFANYFFEGSSLFSELRIPVLSLPRSQFIIIFIIISSSSNILLLFIINYYNYLFIHKCQICKWYNYNIMNYYN